MTRYILRALGIGTFMLIFALVLNFVLLNWLMNCQSWDEQYWTETSSCVTPTEYVLMFTK
jgi:hypothetical protein